MSKSDLVLLLVWSRPTGSSSSGIATTARMAKNSTLFTGHEAHSQHHTPERATATRGGRGRSLSVESDTAGRPPVRCTDNRTLMCIDNGLPSVTVMTRNINPSPGAATGNPSRSGSVRHRLGLSVPAVTGLALLAAVRVPLHDLGIVPEGSVAAGLLALVPPVVWVAVAVRRAVPNPVLTLAVVGLFYGVMLAAIHQLFWAVAFDGHRPALGGTLEGVLDPGVEDLLLRAAVIPSSLLTGIAVGTASGMVAWIIKRVRLRADSGNRS